METLLSHTGSEHLALRVFEICAQLPEFSDARVVVSMVGETERTATALPHTLLHNIMSCDKLKLF